MILSASEFKIIETLDDGSLYAEPDIIAALFDYPDMLKPELTIAYDDKCRPVGYLPTGQFYQDGTRSYIAAMPNSPPISATYPPGAEHVLRDINPPYFDADIISDQGFYQTSTASAYILPVDHYLGVLSPRRRKDMRRKLRQANNFQIKSGTLEDIRTAWEWMAGIWDKRGDRFGNTPYTVYLDMVMGWLKTLQNSQRATLKINKFLLNSQMVGVNCCAIHHYRGRVHCDDYLCWYNPQLASGLGITSAILNLTHPDMQGYRYNLGNPGVYGVYTGHQYKLEVIPATLRLMQAVHHLQPADHKVHV